MPSTTAKREPADGPRTTAWLALAVMVALGAALRVHHLGSGLWYDEIKTLIESVRPPLGQILTTFSSNNDHPLYSVLAHLSISAFGESAWSLRLPAAIAGIAAIPALYAFGTRVTSRAEALAAAGLLALSYHHIWFSQNARGYTLLLLWTLISTHLLLIALERDRTRTYVWYGIVAGLGAYTHLTMVFVVVSHALVVLVERLMDAEQRMQIRTWVNPALGFGVAALLTLLLYAPLLLDLQRFFGGGPSGPNVATPGWALLEFLRQLEIGPAMAVAGALGGLLFLVGCWGYLHQPRVLALALVPAPITLAAAIILERPTFPRFFFFLAGFALLITVRGTVLAGQWIGRILLPAGRPQVVPIALLIGMATVSALALPHGYRYPKQDYEQALAYVEGVSDHAPIVVAGGGAALPYQHYYNRPWKRLDGGDELEALLREHGVVWLLYTFPNYIEAFEPELLRAIRASCNQRRTFTGTVGGGDISVAECQDG